MGENEKKPSHSNGGYYKKKWNNNKKKADIIVQDGESNHEEADTQLLDGSGLADENEQYYCDLFLNDVQEHRSVSLQLTDGMNGGRIPKYWVLLDSQSTTDVFSNAAMLKDIHQVPGSLTLSSMTGKDKTNWRATVPGYKEVWYTPNGIANILSLANVAKTMKVVFNSRNGNQFEVTKRDGSLRIFKQSMNGLYFCDMREE